MQVHGVKTKTLSNLSRNFSFKDCFEAMFNRLPVRIAVDENSADNQERFLFFFGDASLIKVSDSH